MVPNDFIYAGIAPIVSHGASSDSVFIIEERLHELLKSKVERANKVVVVIKFWSTYLVQVTSKPYPEDYVVPKFRKFDGNKGNASDHIVSYINDLGKYIDDDNMKLREFSKSLTKKAYSWFFNLSITSIKTWDELVTAFCTKFFIIAPKVE